MTPNNSPTSFREATTPAPSALGASLDAAEALANAVIGLLVSWAATHFVLGYSAPASLAVTAMFFTLSFTRAWVLRVTFRRLAA